MKEGGILFHWINDLYIDNMIRHGLTTMDYHSFSKHSKEYRAEAARLHRDGRFHGYKGPRWFRNMYGERIQRRDAKFELFKYMRNNEHEVCIVTKQHLPYWL
jgi:hypothetical protein